MPILFRLKKYKDKAELLAFLHEHLDEIAKEYEEYVSEIKLRIQAISETPETLEQKVFLKYVETRSTPKTAESIKSLGIRTSKDTVFSAPDVSKIIKEGHPSVNPSLVRMAREIFDKNTESVIRQYG